MRHSLAILAAFLLLVKISPAQDAGQANAPSAAVQTLLSKAVEAQNSPEVFLPRIDAAIQVARDSHDLPGTLIACRIKAQELQGLGRAEAAAPVWKEVADLSRQLHSASNLVNALGQYALLQRTVAPTLAEDSFRQLIEFAGNDRTEPPGIADILFSLSQSYANVDDFSHAYRLLQTRADLVAVVNPNSIDEAKALVAVGYALGELHETVQADAVLARSESIFQRLAPDSEGHAMALNNLATVALEKGELDRAEEYLQRSLVIKEKIAPGSLSLSKAYNNLAAVYAKREKPVEAKKMYLKALAIREAIGPNTREMFNILKNLMPYEQADGDVQNLRIHVYQAADLIHKVAPGSLDEARALDDVSRFEDTQNDHAKALDMAARAWDIYKQKRENVLESDELEKFSNENWDISYELMHVLVETNHGAEAFMLSEQARAFGLEQVMWERRTDVAGMTTTQARDYRANREKTQEAYLKLQRESTSYDVTRQLLEEERAKAGDASSAAMQQLETKLSEKSRTVQGAESDYMKSRQSTIGLRLQSSGRVAKAPEFSPGEMFELLKEEGTYFLEYSIQGRSAFVFAVEGGKSMRLYSLPLDVATYDERTRQRFDLTGAVRNFRALVTSPDPDPVAVAAQGRALFQALTPLGLDDILRKAKRLIISPDGVLWTLPFAALVTNTSGEPSFLGIEKPITYAQSFSVYRESMLMPTSPAPNPRLLAIGGVVSGQGAPGTLSASNLTPLPFSTAEAKEIAGLYHEAALLGSAASKDTVEKRMGNVDVIHFATHGFYDAVNPMSSGIALSSSKSADPKDAFLQAWEILNQPRLHADLVVLSACDSGRGEAMHAEGMIGMTRAFQAAGARSVVSSLWQVSDESTKDLMVDFHQELRSGITKDEALRRAMLKVHNEPGKSSPYHWAAFVLTGNPDNSLFPESNTGAKSAHESVH